MWWIAAGLAYALLCLCFWCIVRAGALADRRDQINRDGDDEGA
jgi:hypothetical protein